MTISPYGVSIDIFGEGIASTVADVARALVAALDHGQGDKENPISFITEWRVFYEGSVQVTAAIPKGWDPGRVCDGIVSAVRHEAEARRAAR